MALDVLDDPSPKAPLVLAVLLSLLLHGVAASATANLPPRAPKEEVWVEMVMISPPPPAPVPVEVPEPPPPPEPEPPPEPPPVKPPRDEVVDFKPEPTTPPPPPPTQAAPVPRVIQGLSNNSFLEGGATGLAARAGTTTSTKATSETMKLEDASSSALVPYVAVQTQPKIRYQPTLEVPPEVREAGIEGRVEVSLTVDAQGQVSEVAVSAGLHPAADEACVQAMRRSRWKPGTLDGSAVAVRGVPFTCRFTKTIE